MTPRDKLLDEYAKQRAAVELYDALYAMLHSSDRDEVRKRAWAALASAKSIHIHVIREEVAASAAPPAPEGHQTDNKRRRVAMLLGFDPEQPETWYLGAIDRLIEIERRDGEEAMRREVIKMMIPPAPEGT